MSGEAPHSHFQALPERLLTGAILCSIALLLLPLPPWVLDLFLTANLGASISVLLVALSTKHPKSITVFPSLLLLATLGRLALNVSSTRLILSEGQAGRLIQSFSSLVVGGSLLVGAVLFGILTLVQFVVIAKGGERVAEVAARFALDAMPGRQMAIDADLRAGAITFEEARKSRAQLLEEGRLYGAMDGAMKFVKGDALVGLFILGVDLFGGLVMGIFERDMSPALALAHYGRLTIGDGLVTQIPALLLSMSAGLFITRAASAKEATEDARHLGREIFEQMSAQPTIFYWASTFLFLIALAPGMPWWPFLSLAIVSFLIARSCSKSTVLPKIDEPLSPDTFEVHWQLNKTTPNTPLSEEDLLTLLSNRCLNIGVAPPSFNWRCSQTEVSFGTLTLSLGGSVVWQETLKETEALKETETLLNSFLDALCGALPLVLSMQRVDDMLSNWKGREPALLNAINQHLSLYRLTQLLRHLLLDGFSLRPLRPILESTLECPSDASLWVLLQGARIAAGAQLVARLQAYVEEESGILLYVGPRIAETLAEASAPLSPGNLSPNLALNPETIEEILNSITQALEQVEEGPSQFNCIVIAPISCRQVLTLVLRAIFSKPQVVGAEELLPHLGGDALLEDAVMVDVGVGW